jgi:hypothetical protein
MQGGTGAIQFQDNSEQNSMAKLINRGFTNYFGDTPMPIEILSYDNNKYVRIRKSTGEEDEIKRGYIYADEKLTRRIPQINWFILGGGKRLNYRPRKSLTVWDVSVDGKRLKFSTKKEALRVTSALAIARNEELEIWGIYEDNRSWSHGEPILTCMPTGLIYQQGSRKRDAKYQRGYGKIFGTPPNARGTTRGITA